MNFIFLLLEPGEYHGVSIEIHGAKFHHLAHVRRLGVGAILRASLPDGRVVTAEVTEITSDSLNARVIGEEKCDVISPCRITLFQSVLKGEKMEFVVQKASELGVTTLTPLIARRSIPRWTSKQAIERSRRWQRIADSSAEQCERSIPLQVETPRSLQDVLEGDLGTAFLLHERRGQSLPALAGQFPNLPSVGLFIGPEGGWEEDEVNALLEAGVIPVHLGCRILRAETASLVAVTLAQYIWGDLGRA